MAMLKQFIVAFAAVSTASAESSFCANIPDEGELKDWYCAQGCTSGDCVRIQEDCALVPEFIREASWCCNNTKTQAVGMRELPHASYGNCCPDSTKYESCGAFAEAEKGGILCCERETTICEGEYTSEDVYIPKCRSRTDSPSAVPTRAPTASPSAIPTAIPTSAPSNSPPPPTLNPTSAPTVDFRCDFDGVALMPDPELTCSCFKSCPAGFTCKLSNDGTDSYCCPGIGALSPKCGGLQCDECKNEPGCAFFGINGCVDAADVMASHNDHCAATCPTGGDSNKAAKVNTGVIGTCRRRCSAIGSARFTGTVFYREGEDNEAPAEEANEEQKFLYGVPFGPYAINRPIAPRLPPPVNGNCCVCSCDDDCYTWGDCCHDYDMYCESE